MNLKKEKEIQLLELLKMFTTSTDLFPYWNDNKPKWMKRPYMSNGIIYATNGAICITIDPKKIDCGELKFPEYKNRTLVVRNALFDEKEKWILPENWLQCVADVSDEPADLCIDEAKFHEEFWKPIKAAYYFFNAKKLTVITKTEKNDVFGVELIDGVTCYIMPFVE